MSGAAKALQRAITPPKPDIPQAAPQAAPAPAQDTATAAALTAQQETVQRQTAALDAKDAQEAAGKRARMGRQAGRALLLNDELGLPKTLGA